MALKPGPVKVNLRAYGVIRALFGRYSWTDWRYYQVRDAHRFLEAGVEPLATKAIAPESNTVNMLGVCPDIHAEVVTRAEVAGKSLKENCWPKQWVGLREWP
jgi:hypothetical protein